MNEPHDYRNATVFSKCYLSLRKPKASVFKFARLEEPLRTARYRDRLVWTACLTVKIKMRFQISPAVNSVVLFHMFT